jgi:hypothetical protein
MFIIFLCTMAGALLLLGMSIQPGLLIDTVFGFPGFLFWLPLIGGWTLLVAVLAAIDLAPRSGEPSSRKRSKWGLWSAIVTAATFFLLLGQIPDRFGFAISRPLFERLVEEAPTMKEARRQPNGRLVGVIWVDAYYRDARGGVYFRTSSAMDGISPDRRSYGYAYKPNREGSPFGNARGWLRRRSGDWYYFSYSDDW